MIDNDYTSTTKPKKEIEIVFEDDFKDDEDNYYTENPLIPKIKKS